MRAAPLLTATHLTVVIWPDDGFESDAHDVRGRYVETYWLGVLGPTASWLLRRMADELEASPTGFVMDLAETAQCLGVGGIAKNSPFVRALGRLVQFEVARMEGPTTLAVRRRVPSLSRRHLLRLPDTVQRRHAFWQQRQLSSTS